jgi:hypothetical protein
MRRRGNSFCKMWADPSAALRAGLFLFLQKQQTLVSLNNVFGRNCFKMQTVPGLENVEAKA